MEELKVTIEEPSPVTRRVAVEVPAGRVEERWAATLKQYRRKLAMPGFRKGKVPAEVIRRMYAADMAADVGRGLIAETVDGAIDQAGLVPVSDPEFEIVELGEGKPFSYVASFEVRPVFEPSGWEGLELPREPVTVEDEEVQRLVEELRQNHATVRALQESRGLREGDVAVISFAGTVAGAEIPGGSGKDFPLLIGNQAFLPGFEDNLIGAVAGERREFTLRLPEDFPEPGLAGKTALFEVTVQELRERVLPELDDEFARDVGDHEGLEDLRAKLRESVLRSKERAALNRRRDAAVARLVEANPVPVPPAMLERRREAIAQDAERFLVMRGVPWEEVKKSRPGILQDAAAAAERKARAALVLEAIAEREGIAVTEEELAAEIGKIAAANKVDPALVRRRLAESDALEGLAASLRHEKALDLVLERSRPGAGKGE